GHDVHRLGQVLPGARDALDVGLAAEPPFGADFARDAGDLVGERGQLVHHRVHGVLQLEDLAAGVDVGLVEHVAVRDRSGHLGDVAHLVGEVARHEVHRVGQVPPHPADAGHLRLAAQPSLAADFAGDAVDFVGEGGQLVHHRVDGVLQLEDLAAGVDV